MSLMGFFYFCSQFGASSSVKACQSIQKCLAKKDILTTCEIPVKFDIRVHDPQRVTPNWFCEISQADNHKIYYEHSCSPKD